VYMHVRQREREKCFCDLFHVKLKQKISKFSIRLRVQFSIGTLFAKVCMIRNRALQGT